MNLGLSDLAMLGHAHLVGESGSRPPASRVARGNLLKHLVNLLKRQTLGLGNKEVSVDASAGAQSAPHEEDLGTEVALTLGLADHVRSDGSDDCVPQPVAGGRETDTTRTNGQREDLTNKNPSARTPGRSEEGDGETDEGDLSRSSGVVVDRDGGAEDGSQKLTGEHAQGTPDEQGTTTEAFDSPERDGSRKDVDEGGDETDEEGVRNCALLVLVAVVTMKNNQTYELLEEGGTEEEDEVDTSPLLHHLQGSAKNSTTEVAVGLPERSLEAVGPRREVAALRDDRQLVLVVGDDLGEFLGDELRVDGLTTNGCESLGSLLVLALLDKVTRRLGQESNATTEDEGPQELNSHRNTV